MSFVPRVNPHLFMLGIQRMSPQVLMQCSSPFVVTAQTEGNNHLPSNGSPLPPHLSSHIPLNLVFLQDKRPFFNIWEQLKKNPYFSAYQ